MELWTVEVRIDCDQQQDMFTKDVNDQGVR